MRKRFGRRVHRWRMAAATICAIIVCFGSVVGRATASHVQCGAVITQNTTLDSDLIGCPGKGIIIGADNITLDLNGHTVTGAGAASISSVIFEDAALDNGAGYDDVTIVDGTVVNLRSVGVNLFGASGNVLRKLSIIGGGIYLDGFALGNAFGNRIVNNESWAARSTSKAPTAT
jgi:hypothetical protein